MTYVASSIKGTVMIIENMLLSNNETADIIFSLISGTDSSKEVPQTFQEAWWHSNENERKLWREAIRKEFHGMIKRGIWRN